MEKEKIFNYTFLNNTNNTTLNHIIQRDFLKHKFYVTEFISFFVCIDACFFF